MVLKNCEVLWTKTVSGYTQGIKGGKNYKHFDSDGSYNGHGGADLSIPSDLNLKGYDIKTRKKVIINIKDYFLESLGRKLMNDKLYWILRTCLPERISIDENMKITQSSLDEIKANYENSK